MTRDLNQIFRRLLHYENQEQWLGAVHDGLALGANSFGVFTIENAAARLRSAQGIAIEENTRFPLSSARAFNAAAESREPLVALRTASEVGVALQSQNAGARAHLFPVANAGRTVAMIFGEADSVSDVDALELVTSMASAVLERQMNRQLQMQIGPAPNGTAKQSASLPRWANLNAEAQKLHSNAQRFARTAVASMQLARPAEWNAGLEQESLYLLLQGEIDKARATYSRQYMSRPSMADYLHGELIKAAGGDERALGADYPGQLV